MIEHHQGARQAPRSFIWSRVRWTKHFPAREAMTSGGGTGQFPLSESSFLSPAFRPLPSAGSLRMSGLQRLTEKSIPSSRGWWPFKQRADSCHSRPSQPWLSQPHLTSMGPDCYSLPLPGRPPLTALLSVQERVHTCPRVGLRGLEPRASESPVGEPGGAGCRPCRSPTREAPTPRSRSRFSLPGAPPARVSLTWRLFIFLRSPKMSKPEAGRCVPTAPARTMAGSPGADTARRLRVLPTAAEHRPGPRPPAPRPCAPRDRRLARASGSRSPASLSHRATWKELRRRKLPLPECRGARGSSSEDPELLGRAAMGLRSVVPPFRANLGKRVILHIRETTRGRDYSRGTEFRKALVRRQKDT